MTTSEIRIIVGDCLDKLRAIPDESVHCVITSPPYWGLRDYGVDGAIGLEDTFEEHLEKLLEVFGEVWRVLRKDGTLWLNYGDAYVGGGRTGVWAWGFGVRQWWEFEVSSGHGQEAYSACTPSEFGS